MNKILNSLKEESLKREEGGVHRPETIGSHRIASEYIDYNFI